MDNVSTRILSAFHDIWRDNRKPESIYLGRDEMHALLNELEKLAGYFRDLDSLRPKQFGGVPLYQVEEQTHFYICGATP